MCNPKKKKLHYKVNLLPSYYIVYSSCCLKFWNNYKHYIFLLENYQAYLSYLLNEMINFVDRWTATQEEIDGLPKSGKNSLLKDR